MVLMDDLPHRCTIRKRVFARGPLGDKTETTTVVSTNVPCWIQNANHGEIAEFERRAMKVTRKVYFQTDPGVRERHEIIQTSADRGATTLTTQVAMDVLSESLPDASAGMGILFKVMCFTTDEIQVET